MPCFLIISNSKNFNSNSISLHHPGHKAKNYWESSTINKKIEKKSRTLSISYAYTLLFAW